MSNPYIKNQTRLLDAEYNGLPVKVKLLTAKEKREFIEILKSGDDSKSAEALSSKVLKPDGSPVFSPVELDEEIPDTESAEFLEFFLSYNGRTKPDDTLKNSKATPKS